MGQEEEIHEKAESAVVPDAAPHPQTKIPEREDTRTRAMLINNLEKEITAIKLAQTNLFVMKQGYGTGEESLSKMTTFTAKIPLDEKMKKLETLKAERKAERKSTLQRAASFLGSIFHT